MQATYPLGTIVYYGPDDKTITKMVASVIQAREVDPIQMEWRGRNINEDPGAIRELGQFFKTHQVARVVMSEKIAGCEHTPGVDYPEGDDCPYCPFWVSEP